MERLTEAERRGEYTLERLDLLRPDAIQEIIRLRGQWVGMQRIAKIVGVHHKTVSAVDVAYPQQIGDVRQRLIQKMRSASEKLVELIDESPESVPWNVKALAASQLIDKAELLDGRATVRVEQVERIDIYSDWDQFVEDQLEPQKTIDIVAVKVAETGLNAEENPPIEEAG